MRFGLPLSLIYWLLVDGKNSNINAPTLTIQGGKKRAQKSKIFKKSPIDQ